MLQKRGVDAEKTASKKVVHKTVEATRELIGNIIVEKTAKPKPVHNDVSGNFEEIVIPPEKIEEILIEVRQVL